MKHTLPLGVLFSILGLFTGACASLFNLPAEPPPASVTATITPSPSPTITHTPTQTTTPLPGDMAQTFILSMDDNGYNHLFAFAPTKMTPVRLTSGQWDDIAPAINRDGNRVVFASNRNAYWDIYILNLNDGQITRLTDTPEFDGNPAWSPDDQWIVYETLVGEQMEISILSTSNPDQIFQLTDDPAFDGNPAWSPQGREVAFVSNRSGENEIWVINLDKPDEGRFINISQSPNSSENHPAWSADGNQLAWAAQNHSDPDGIYIWDKNQPNTPAKRIGDGNLPVWGLQENEIATRQTDANQDYLTGYTFAGILTTPPIPLHNLRGMDLHLERITGFSNVFYKQAFLTPDPLWNRQEPVQQNNPGQRASIIKLNDVDAPYPYLLDAVIDSYDALRLRVIRDTGWDALASLENAYTPLTSVLDPGKSEDWLFTGRAFAINPLTMNAGWMMVLREDIGGRTYWHIYLRTVAQDGSQGEPMRELPWELTSRYSLDPGDYDQGGAYAENIPTGYWFDFTAIALKYGWERIPAFDNWRAYFRGTRFNEFVLRNGLDWRQAMLNVYPEIIFTTPTAVIPPTHTPTPTPKGYRYTTPTPTPTETPTMRPTYTTAP